MGQRERSRRSGVKLISDAGTRRYGDAARKAKDRGHPSSPYGLRRDKEGRRQRAEDSWQGWHAILPRKDVLWIALYLLDGFNYVSDAVLPQPRRQQLFSHSG